VIGSYGREIAIGSFGLISLFMASTIIRKGLSGPVVAVATAGARRQAPHFDDREDIAGLAGGVSSMLDGLELDEETVRVQQMFDQVSTMVDENPDAAANLVKRWLN